MNLRVFTDIDDTLMSTERKSNLHEVARVGAHREGGAPSSFVSHHQARLLQMLSQASACVVPVTARSEQSLARVQLEFPHGAIVNYGQTILLPGMALDESWHTRMCEAAALREDGKVYQALRARFSSRDGHGFAVAAEHRVVRGLDTFLNLRLPRAGQSVELLQATREFLAAQGLLDAYDYHHTDRDVTVIPRYVNKGDAVLHFIESHGWAGDTLVGAADSLVDCSFLQHMHFCVLPTGSRAFEALMAQARDQGATR